jgi:hypothetical protein
MHTRSIRVSNVCFSTLMLGIDEFQLFCSVVFGNPLLLCIDLEALVAWRTDLRHIVVQTGGSLDVVYIRGFWGFQNPVLPMIRTRTTHNTLRMELSNPVNFGNKHC